MSEKILIIEDEAKIARFIELELIHEGYKVSKSGNGREGLEMAESENFDLVLLDIMLPGLNGLEVMRRLRKTSDVPVIMLIARDAVMDKVSGLDMGANDYVTKPFAIEELLARIRVLLRMHPNKNTADKNILTWGKLKLDTACHSIEYDEEPINLTNKEFMMMELMLSNINVVITREKFMDEIWGYDFAGETNTVDVYIRYLRGKVDNVYGTNMIKTVRGVGYVIKEFKE